MALKQLSEIHSLLHEFEESEGTGLNLPREIPEDFHSYLELLTKIIGELTEKMEAQSAQKRQLVVLVGELTNEREATTPTTELNRTPETIKEFPGISSHGKAKGKIQNQTQTASKISMEFDTVNFKLGRLSKQKDELVAEESELTIEADNLGRKIEDLEKTNAALLAENDLEKVALELENQMNLNRKLREKSLLLWHIIEGFHDEMLEDFPEGDAKTALVDTISQETVLRTQMLENQKRIDSLEARVNFKSK
jgi:hypothetical protein